MPRKIIKIIPGNDQQSRFDVTGSLRFTIAWATIQSMKFEESFTYAMPRCISAVISLKIWFFSCTARLLPDWILKLCLSNNPSKSLELFSKIRLISDKFSGLRKNCNFDPGKDILVSIQLVEIEYSTSLFACFFSSCFKIFRRPVILVRKNLKSFLVCRPSSISSSTTASMLFRGIYIMCFLDLYLASAVFSLPSSPVQKLTTLSMLKSSLLKNSGVNGECLFTLTFINFFNSLYSK